MRVLVAFYMYTPLSCASYQTRGCGTFSRIRNENNNINNNNHYRNYYFIKRTGKYCGSERCTRQLPLSLSFARVSGFPVTDTTDNKEKSSSHSGIILTPPQQREEEMDTSITKSNGDIAANILSLEGDALREVRKT